MGARVACLLPLLSLIACGTPGGGALSGGEAALKGCLADWDEGFRSLPPLVDRADLIVRAKTVSSRTTAERWGVGYRTTLRVERVLKGAPVSTVTVIESVCPVLYGGPDDWLLFLAPKLDEQSVFQTPGGVQGAFPVKGGRIFPIYEDAILVRTYGGSEVAEVEREIGAIRPVDGDAAALLTRAGWTVAGKGFVRLYDLPPASEFGETKMPPRFERPFEGYALIATKTGLDLRPFGGSEIEELSFFLERLPQPDASAYPPVAHLIFAARRYVGGWVQVGASQIFRLDERAAALAAPPRAPVPPTPAPNRYPSGVNVVTEYGLANASSAYVKPLIPSITKAVPAPPLRDLLAALDRSFATESAPPRRSDGYWIVGFVLGDRYLTFEYYADAELLVQRDDGYAIRPGAAFGRLIGAVAP